MAPTARSTRSTKKAKVGEEVEREEIDIAPLSGALTKLVSIFSNINSE